jgi:hypothetical protein
MPNDNSEEKKRVKTSATQRLVDVLDKMLRTTTNNNVALTLVSVIDIHTDDPNRSALWAFSSLTQMIELSEAEAHRYHPDMWDTLGPHYSGVRACFAPQTSGATWNQHKGHLTASDFTGLKHEAGHLRRHVSEVLLREDELHKVYAAVREMEDAIENERLYRTCRRHRSISIGQ